MSVHVLARFMDRSQATLGARLIGMVMADSAGDDGICWLSQEKLRHRTRLSERAVRDSIRALEELHELETRKAQRGPRRVNVYRLWCASQPDYDRLPFEVDRPFGRPADSAAGAGARPAKSDTYDRQNDAPALSIERKKNVRELATAPAARPPDLIWDELERRFGAVAEKTNAHAKRNKAVIDLKRQDATVETIRTALRVWPQIFPGASITDLALSTHFVQLVAHGSASRRVDQPVAEVVNLPELDEEQIEVNLAKVRELRAGIGR